MDILDVIDIKWVQENPQTALELIKLYREENKRTIEAIHVLEDKIESLREMNLMKAVVKEINEDYEILSDWT